MRVPSSSSSRRGAPFVGLLLGGALALGVAGCSSSGHQTSAASTSPFALLQAATTNAQAEGWAHLDVSDHEGAKVGTITQDSGPNEGHQIIQNGTVDAQVIWVGGTAFIMGNAQAVTTFFGFPASDGATLAGHWISIPPSNADYSTVTEGVSLASVLQETGVAGQLTETATTTRDGQRVVGVQGTASSPEYAESAATLYVTTGPHPLPVEFDVSSAQDTEQAVFGDWGKAVSLAAPTGALPIPANGPGSGATTS